MRALALYKSQVPDGFFISYLQIIKPSENQIDNISFYSKLYLNFCEIIHRIDEHLGLKIILIKHSSSKKESKNFKEIPAQNSQILLGKVFMAAELDEYLGWSGDNNSLHLKEPKIVPGLLILQFLESSKQFALTYFSVKFHKPLFLNTEFKVLQVSEYQYIGVVEKDTIFNLKLA